MKFTMPIKPPSIEVRLAAITEKIRERLEYAYDVAERPGGVAWFKEVGYFEKIEKHEREKLRLVAEFIEKHGEHPAIYYAGPSGPSDSRPWETSLNINPPKPATLTVERRK